MSPDGDPRPAPAIADPGKQDRAARGIPVVPAFDGFRAYAILLVVLFHIFQVSGVFVALGDGPLGVLAWGVLPRSVDVLFVVSGFVLYLPTVARGGDFGRTSSFAIRRAARLVPAYYVCVVIALLALATVPGPRALPGVGEIATHLAVLQTPALLFDPQFPLGLGVIPPVWTLSVEVGFYLVLPLIAALYFRHPLWGLAIAGAIAVAWKAIATELDSVVALVGVELGPELQAGFDGYYASQLPSWGFALAAGMTAAWAYVRLAGGERTPERGRRAGWALAISTGVLAAVVVLGGRDAVADPSPELGLFSRQPSIFLLGYPAAFAAAMLALALAPGWWQRPFSSRPIRELADVSYGVYLVHFAVIFVVLFHLSLPQDGSIGALLAWSALVYPLSIVYAYLSARFLEQPVRRWAQRYGRRAQTRRAAGGEQTP